MGTCEFLYYSTADKSQMIAVTSFYIDENMQILNKLQTTLSIWECYTGSFNVFANMYVCMYVCIHEVALFIAYVIFST